MSQTGLKTGDLDLDFQGQIGLETKKFCATPCECNNFLTVGILPSNLSYALIIN